jgi:penicillin-binding protein 2
MNLDLARHRLTLLFALAGLPVLIYLATLWRLQVVEGDEHRREAENNTARKLDIRAQRGTIFDREGRPLSQNMVRYVLTLGRGAVALQTGADGKKYRGFSDEVIRQAESLGYSLKELEAAKLASPPGEPIILDHDFPYFNAEKPHQSAAWFIAHRPEYHREFRLDYDSGRNYPYKSAAAHVLGYLGAVTLDDLGEARELAAENKLLPGSQIGRSGIEKAFDRHLTGTPGARRLWVNALGQEVKLAGFKSTTLSLPEAGKSLRLSIDMKFEQVIEKAFDGRFGAAVVMDTRTGDILALTSQPGYDLNELTGHIAPEVWKRLQTAPGTPFVNRATEAAYAPGSVWKTVMALAALNSGAIRPETQFTCYGKIHIYDRDWQCTGHHGTLDLVHAIEKSCNVYFYNVGMKMKADDLEKFGQQLGLGQLTGIGLNEKPGIMPGPLWKREEFARRVANKWVADIPHNQWMKNWYAGESLSVAIGQGQTAVTPLQVARLMATIATDGTVFVPRLVTRIGGDEQPVQSTTLKLSPKDLAVLKQGMYLVVNGAGTARASALPDIPVCGKTGTAQLVGDETVQSQGGRKGGHLAGLRENSWFAGFAPCDKPQLAFAIIVEQGGHGSESAAPIVRTALDWWFHQRRPPTPAELQPQLRLAADYGNAGPVTIAPPVSAAAPLSASAPPDHSPLETTPGKPL